MNARLIWRYLLVAFFGAAGVIHIVAPAAFLRITPGWVPYPDDVIFYTGVAEILGAVGVLIPQTRRLAGGMLALYVACVWPANIKHALDALDGWTGLPPSWWYHLPRQFLQPVIFWWALYVTHVTDWPFARPTNQVR